MTTAPGKALLIGNSAYAEAALANPGNDAEDIGAVLRDKLHWDVTVIKDCKLREMVWS